VFVNQQFCSALTQVLGGELRFGRSSNNGDRHIYAHQPPNRQFSTPKQAVFSVKLRIDKCN
ncbi:MAG: hypothetical protein ACMG55_09130, partial [Microcoleus sp.]